MEQLILLCFLRNKKIIQKWINIMSTIIRQYLYFNSFKNQII